MAISVPANAIVNFGNLRSDGSELFISALVTLSGGAATVAHGFTRMSGSGGRVAAGAVPTAAFIIPLDGEDHSGATLTVDDTSVIITGGATSGKLIVVAIR